MGRKIDVTITYLRQDVRPAPVSAPHPPGKIAILRAERPPVHFYRYLYDLIGGPWNWVSRKRIDDAQLAEIILADEVYIYVLYVGGVPAGLAEIDGRDRKQVEIRFFGLAPDFIGKGFSRYFLSNTIDLAWMLNPATVQLETCTLDHPAALPLYQKFGFTVFDQRQGVVELLDPEGPEAV
jgi:GNAT superfamily N-acetyltransferase